MKLFYLSIFVQVIIVNEAREQYGFKTPKNVQVIAMEPPGLQVIWESTSTSYEDPIIEYKINILTIKTYTERKYELVNGEQFPGIVVDTKPAEVFSPNKTIDSSAREIIVRVDRKKFKASFKILTGIQYNVLYEVRVYAFNRQENGPMSKPIRVMIVKGNGFGAIVQRGESGCLLSLPSALRGYVSPGLSDDYPFLHNSYI